MVNCEKLTFKNKTGGKNCVTWLCVTSANVVIIIISMLGLM